MDDRSLRRCLQDGLGPEDWCRLLNGRVFFWLSRELQARDIEPLAAIGRTQPQRPYDVRLPPAPKTPRQIKEPWCIEMKAKLATEDANAHDKRRKHNVEPVFGISKNAMGFI